MSNAAIHIHPKDNVAVALRPIEAGETIEVAGKAVTVLDKIPPGHKIAVSAIASGDGVVKYGHRIGLATAEIRAGAWVHSHNLKTGLGAGSEYAFRPGSRGDPAELGPAATFMGYKREDGRVGTRNEIWIIPTVGCINATAERLALLANERFGVCPGFDGTAALTHPYGCSQLGEDLEMTRKLLRALVRHPNAGGVLILGLGCENNRLEGLLDGDPSAVLPRVRAFSAQAVDDELETGMGLIAELLRAMSFDRRTEAPASSLVLGMKCGGSDAFSGLTANPLAGRVADWVDAAGGTALLSEVPEMFGAEAALLERARDRGIFDKAASLIEKFKDYYRECGQPIHENPSPGNVAGGLTTLEEKSLGAVQKGGRAVITQVLDYGDPAPGPGLGLVEAPGNDAVSSTALAAAGATILLFTTGCGTPFGAAVPTLKISSTTDLALRKPHWIDLDAGRIVSKGESFETLARDAVRAVLDTASGRLTNSEVRRFKEIAIWKKGVTL